MPVMLMLTDEQCRAIVAAGTVPAPAPIPVPVPTPIPTPVPTPVPVPTPPAGGNTARWTSAPGDWARWNFSTSEEQINVRLELQNQGYSADQAMLRVNQQINAYYSTINLPGQYDAATNVYQFMAVREGMQWTVDQNGAADAYVQKYFPGVVQPLS